MEKWKDMLLIQNSIKGKRTKDGWSKLKSQLVNFKSPHKLEIVWLSQLKYSAIMVIKRKTQLYEYTS